jgi:DNA-binding transcriptional ArsR family regulator
MELCSLLSFSNRLIRTDLNHCKYQKERRTEGKTHMSASKGKKPTQRGKAVKRSVEEALDQRLLKALAHPVRVQCLSLMVDGEWSPNRLHKELGVGLSQISYHIKVLKDFELIEMTRTEPRRGAVEHFYRAKERIIIPESMSSALPRTARLETLRRILSLAEKDMKKSLKAGTFYNRPDFHASWSPFVLDEQGRAKLHGKLDQLLADAIETEVESLDRLTKEGGQSIPTSLVIFAFGSERKAGEKGSAFRQRS